MLGGVVNEFISIDEELTPVCKSCMLLILLLALTYPVVGYSSSEDQSEEIIEDAHQAGALSKGKWVAVPIPVSNPTLGTGLQAALLYLHPTKDEDTPNATSGIAAMYTDTDSWFVGGFHDNNFKQDKYRLKAFGGYGVLNLDFFGVGNTNLPDAASLPYEFKGALGSVRFLSRLPSTDNWYLGLQYLFLDSEITFETSMLNPLLPDVNGKVTTAALGLVLTYDSRDDNYYPIRGQYTEAKYMNFGETWGGDYDYEKIIGYYNVYASVHEKVVLAGRVRIDTSSGDTPFFNLAYLDMRGFPRGLYLDDSSLSLTAEARYKFLPRWGVIGFYEMGWINNSFSQLTNGKRVTSYGGGLRWQVTKDKKLNLGLDFAVSTDDQAIYVRIGEQF